MRKIIDGKYYDTATADLVCDVSGTFDARSDHHFDDTQLYRSPRGRFFVAGGGGPRSRWALAIGQGYTGGSGLEPVSTEEARSLCERHGRLNDAEYAKFFDAPVEG